MNKNVSNLIALAKCIGNIEGKLEALPSNKSDIDRQKRKQLESDLKKLLAERDRTSKLIELEEAAIQQGAKNPSLVADYALQTISDDMLLPDVMVRKVKLDPSSSFMFSDGAPTSPSIKNPWKKETFNLTEQAILLNSNPALASRFKSEAVA